MCNSYNNGHCDYYGVEVREMNYKCERGECMPIIFTEQGDRKYVPYLEKDEFILDMEKLEIVEISTGNRMSVHDSGSTLAQIQEGMEYRYKQKERG